MSTAEQDLNVGRSIATDMLEQLHATMTKLPDDAARALCWLGLFAGLAGAASKSIGTPNTVMALRASINAVSKEIPK